METLKDLKDLRASKIDAQGKILYNEQGEKRTELSQDQQKQFDDLDQQIQGLDAKIERAAKVEAAEKRLAAQKAADKGNRKPEEQRAAENFSFQKAAQTLRKRGALEGLEKEMHEEAENEARQSGVNLEGQLAIPSRVAARMITHSMQKPEQRSLNATGGTAGDQGGVAVQTTVDTTMLTALRPKLQLAQMGAVTLGNLNGNYDQATLGETTTAWEGEEDEVADGTPGASKRGLTPKRLGTKTIITKQLINTSSPDIEALVQNDIFNAIAAAIEAAAINGGGSNQPEGILATSGINIVYAGGATASGTNADGAALVRDDIVNLEKEVAIDNADMGSLGYLVNAKVRAALKNTKADAGSGIFLWPAGATELNGYRVGTTNHVPSNLTKNSGTGLSAMIFGNFSDLVIGQWGGIDLVVDEYTLAQKGQMRMVANVFLDTMLRRTESFAAIKDAIAS
mgnify:CR=1 FL=1